MDKNMSQTKNNFTASTELGHQKSDKNLSETNFDEDSGFGVSGYSHDYPLNNNSVKSKGPQETSKQKEDEEPDYIDSGFECGFHSEPLIDPKEMVQLKHEPTLVDGFDQLRLTDHKREHPKEPWSNNETLHRIFKQDEDGDT